MIIGDWEVTVVKESGKFPLPGKIFLIDFKHNPTSFLLRREIWFIKPYTEQDFAKNLEFHTKDLKTSFIDSLPKQTPPRYN